MASDIKEAIRRLIYQYSVEGADKVMATQEAVATSTSKTDKASLSLEKAFGSLERRYVETVRAQQDYQKVQEKVNAAVAQNPALQERANVVLAQARQHFDNVAIGAGKADIAATVFMRTISRTIGPLAAVGVAVAAVSSAMEFMQPIAVRVGTDIYNRFSQAYPAVAQFAEGIYNAGKQFIEFENARAKVEAIDAAMRGVASSAQLAALKMESFNQKLVNQRGLAEAAQAAERMADHVMRLREIYPGVTQETAKQLELLEAQLAVARARTTEEEAIAQVKLRQVQLTQQGVSEDEQQLIIALERAKAEADVNKQREKSVYYSQSNSDATNEQYAAQESVADAADDTTDAINEQYAAQESVADAADNTTDAISSAGNELQRNVVLTNQVRGASTDVVLEWVKVLSLVEQVDARLNMLSTQFAGKQYEFSYDPLQTQIQKAALQKTYGADMLKEVINNAGMFNQFSTWEVDPAKLAAQQAAGYPAMIGGMDISTPGAASQALANTLALGLESGLSNVTRVIDAVADPATQASLVQQAINYVMSTQPPSLAREEMINTLNSKLQGLISSTDSLNATMQNALSPFYSQDPRTTHLGFRAGVVGNPEWQVGGASNTNPLAAILGAGATAPGMAGGGSFMVGGGYSANDNKIAAFPVASGEEVIVNRNRKGGQAGQVIHIDNRTIINGRVDADVFAQMKVSKYQQTQRMRAGLAVA